MSPAFRVAHKPRLQLTRQRKLMIYTILGTTWGSGALWLLFHYFFPHQGEFGDEPNPLEHPLLMLHGAAAFAALWLAGWLWTTHIAPWWNSPNRRNSGVVLIAMGAMLVVSGWLLYYASGDELRRWTAVLHWGVGLVLVVPAVVHGLRAGRYRRPG